MAAKTAKLVSSLQEMFFQSVENFPDQIAVAYSSYGVVTISYYDLGRMVEKLSSLFKEIFADNEVISVYSKQYLHLPTILLAILHSSAAFYPMSTSLDPQMVLNTLERRNIRYILVENCLVGEFLKEQNKQNSTFTVDTPRVELFIPEDQEVCQLLQKVQVNLFKVVPSDKCVVEWDEKIAYVMQTSGTTGEPKAVFVPHSCILPNIIDFSSIFELTYKDVVLLASPYTFDPFIVQMFLALANGATLLVVPDSEKLLPRSLCSKLFGQHKVTIFQPTPSFLYYIGEDLIKETILSETSPLSVLAIGGEACPPLSTLRKWKHPKCTTKIYNIYGITEISSWATCYHISDEELSKAGSDEQRNPHCPIGSPLTKTRVTVYDDNGSIVMGDGVGHLWIGGDDRKCLLEGESPGTIPPMRDSGDVVEVKDGQMRHLGRSDNQLKRFGCLVNLDSVEKVVLCVDGVASCAVILQPTTVGNGLIHLFVTLVTNMTIPKEKLKSKLKSHLMLVLPHAAQPDAIHVIPKLLLTNHGKVDKRGLLKYLDEQSVDNLYVPVAVVLGKMWRDCCQFDKNCEGESGSVLDGAKDCELSGPKSQDRFVLQGGDSFRALRLADTIERWARKRWGARVDLASLVGIIINDRFDQLVKYVEKQSTEVTLPHGPTLKTSLEDHDTSPAKKLKRDNISPAKINLDVDSVQVEGNTTALAKPITVAQGRVVCVQCKDSSGCPVLSAFSTHRELSKGTALDQFNISLKWKTSLGKCIDASPLVVVTSCLLTDGEVFIGSHSHLFMAVSLTTGDVKWKVSLAGRVESSSCLSLSARLVVVGCYDGNVYAITRCDGTIVFTFQTGDAVKSSPCLDRDTGFIWVGSHDTALYALDVEQQLCQFRVDCRGGSCFSSPTIGYEPHRVYAGTLAGRFLSIDAVSGDVMWCKEFDKPIFSSPLVHGGHIYIGTVDGCLKCLDHGGCSLWEFRTTGEIFSSPVLMQLETGSETRLIIGSHDHCLNCVSHDGKLQWSCRLDSPIYSTPWLTPFTVASPDGLSSIVVDNSCLPHVIVVITTKGTLYLLDSNDGNVLKTFSFPGEVFSSPAVIGRQLVVGCRDDFLYCLSLF